MDSGTQEFRGRWGGSPRFEHDCTRCHYLGSYTDDVTYDLYQCDRGPGLTYIARYGSDGYQYFSGIQFADLIPAVQEAKRRAQAQGLVETT